MRKYWVIFVQTFALFSTYRLGIVFSIAQSFVTPLIMLTALGTAKAIGGISAAGLLPYYILVGLTYSIVRSDVDSKIDDMTTEGDVNNFLLKPLRFYTYMLVRELSQNLVSLVIVIPIVIIFFIFGAQKFQLNMLRLIPIVPALAISFALYFNFSYLIGLFSFWIDEFWGIHNVKFVIVQFLGGVVLPYTFFPVGATQILRWTPFPYMVSWVARSIQGRFQLFDFGVAISWVIISFVLAKLLENKAISKYSFTGN